MTDTPDPTPGRMPLMHLGLYAAVAACLALSPAVQRRHSPDSLIPVLVSLYAWEPFFWEQARVGMIWPLLATPLTDPFANLVAQTAVVLFCTLAAPLLLGLVLLPRPGAAPLAAGLVNAWYLATLPEVMLQNHFISSYHGSATAIGCLGLLLIRPGCRWRLVAAGAHLVVAHWVYVAVVFFLLPVALGRGWVNPGRPGVGRPLLRPLSDPRSRIGVLLTMAGFGVGVLLMGWAYLRSGGAYKTESGSLPPTDWPDTWARLFQTLGTLPASRVWVGGLAGAAVVGLVMVWANRRWSAWAVPTAGVLVFTGVAEWLVMGTRQWVALNLYHPRYLLGLVTAWQLAAAVLLVAPLAGWAAGRGRWVVFASVALALGGVVQTEYGPPSAAAVRRVYDERFGQYTADVLAAGADAVAGDYWTVWPAVFHINMVRHARGEPPVFGVADRGRPWRSRWVPPRPVVLVAVPHGQEEAVAAQSPGGTFSPFTPAGDFDTVAVFRSRPLP